MVAGQQQELTASLCLDQRHPEQRSLFKVEGLAGNPPGLHQDLIVRACQVVDPQASFVIDDLHDTVRTRVDGGEQNLVPAGQLIETRLQDFEIQPALDLVGGIQVVRRRFRSHLVEQPYPVLCGGEWYGCAVRSTRDRRRAGRLGR